MSQIGKAYIEITADLKKFPADLRTKLKAALKEGLTGVEFTGLEDKAKEAGEHAAEAAGKSFERKAKDRFRRAGEDGGRSLLGGLRKIFSRNSSESTGFFGSLTGFFGGIASSIKDAVSSAGQSATSAGGSAFSSLTGVFGGGGDIMGGLKIAAFAVLIPVVLGLAGALYQLSAVLFTLPAAAGVAVTAILPLVIAFQGFGEAVGAGLSGDTEKFNEALKGLAPPARSVVKELVGLKGQFTGIKQSVQGAFFAPLKGFFTEFGRTLLPLAARGLTKVAGSLGGLVRSLANVFVAPQNLVTFNALFGSTNRIVQTMEPAVANLAQALLNLIQPALPFLEKAATAFRDWSGTVEAFTKRIAKDGSLTGWLNRAVDIGKKLWSLFKEAGKFVGTLLNSFGDEGTDTIRGLADAFKDLNTYLKSDAGKEFLHNVGVLIHWAGDALVFFVATLQGSFLALNLTFSAVRWLAKALETLGGAVWTAIKAVGSFFAMLGGWVATGARAVGDFFTKTIPGWIDSAVNFFQELPGRVVDALNDLRIRGRQFIIDTLTDWYQGILFKVGEIIAIFLSLPQLIPAALSTLGDALGSAWDRTWAFVTTAVSDGIHNVVAAITGIPGLLLSAGESIWNWASDLWTRVSDTTQQLVTGGINKVIDFFTGIPGRIRALGPQVLDAARSIGHKIADGLTEIGNFASDLGKKVTNALKSGINWVIDSINSGIASIDEKLPGALPRIPRLAKGAIVDSPTLALVGEAGPEVVMPLNNSKRAQELAEQSGLLGLLSRGTRTVVNVVAYLDPSGVIIPMTRTVINDTMDEQGDELSFARAA